MPCNLQHLTLDLFGNKLGKNVENIKYLAEGMKYLPSNLQNLTLYLPYNELG